MLRQTVRWVWAFWPWSGDRGLWLSFIVGACLLGDIAASARDDATRQIVTPDFSVIDIAIRPGNRRVPLAFKVKLAKTEAQRRHGLMFTPYLPQHHGMLFVFETDAVRQFWMKNTQIPLDMLFFASDGRLVNVIHSAAPFSLTARNSAGPVRYVLELNAGVADEIGVQPDAKLVLPLAVQ